MIDTEFERMEELQAQVFEALHEGDEDNLCYLKQRLLCVSGDKNTENKLIDLINEYLSRG